ncbi:MAG: helix-turn-helix transcriptional regulator [Flavobacteriales bacterium]|nr:helix-turn-helix transcriptional regulator [Flavobacteriales bacterium]
MNIYDKVKTLREDKKISQEFMAHQLGLSQSQYSRRESGEIKFVVEEIAQLAKVLETSVAELFGEQRNSFAIHTQNGGSFGQYVSIPEKLIEQYEARLREKDEMIRLLKR